MSVIISRFCLLRCIGLLAFSLLVLPACGTRESIRKIWEKHSPLNRSDIRRLREEAWSMFDFGYSSYLKHAFPKDNLLPITCQGEDWQSGIGVTLIDCLDTLLIMNRRADMETAIDLLRNFINFDKDEKVHVFETTIRVLGGLLSAHILVARQPGVVQGYDDLFLRMAIDFANLLLPAFDTPTGIPTLWVHLKTGKMPEFNVTCTACAGTLLLEFGALSQLTGDPKYLAKADRVAKLLFERRSRLGLVGSSMSVFEHGWVHRETSIGPGTDSYYEYLLKAYLMFGAPEYLDMFADLYVSTMRHLQTLPTVSGHSFLVDVHMDSGRCTKPFVSSLGAFWPGMQALVGQGRDAVDLHANYTAAWRTFGYLPESFGLDLMRVHPEDPGYNLRPEHIESTYLLHATTGDPAYLNLAANIQRTLESHNKVKCGYAKTSNVVTGQLDDIMESYFLSETAKYLYLIFADAPQLVHFYVFSTEGHLLPVFTGHRNERPYPPSKVPKNCQTLCQPWSDSEMVAALSSLRSTFPLLPFRSSEAALLRQRRCTACVVVTQRMAAAPPFSDATKAAMMKLPPELMDPSSVPPAPGTGGSVLAQVLCLVVMRRNRKLSCQGPRLLTHRDLLQGLPHNALIMQMTAFVPQDLRLTMIVGAGADPYAVKFEIEGSTAMFGPAFPQLTQQCLDFIIALSTVEGHSCTAESLSPGPPPVCHLWGGSIHHHLAHLGNPCMNNQFVMSRLSRHRYDPYACRPVGGPLGQIKGTVVLVERGGCNFQHKVLNMQAAGAVAVIIINTEGSAELLHMSGDGHNTPTIPATMVTHSSGRALMSLLNGPHDHMPRVMIALRPPLPKPKTNHVATRVDVLIPVSSQGWLQSQVMPLVGGTDPTAVFTALAQDKRVTELLTQQAAHVQNAKQP